MGRPFHYAWVIVAIGAVTGAITSTMRLAFGVFLEPMEELFGWTRSAASATYAIQFLVFGVSSIAMGRISDRWGTRPLLVAGGLLFTVAMLLTARATALWQVYVTYGIMLGLAGAAFFTPVHTMVTRWFGRGVGIGLGLVVAAQALGPMVLAPYMRYLIAILDWSQAFTWTGLVGGFLVVGASLLARNDPADLGLQPYGGAVVPALTAPLNGQQDPSGSTSDRPDRSPQIPLESTEKLLFAQARQTRPFWILPLVHFLGCVSHAIPLVHVVPMATAVGVAPVLAAAVLGLVSAFSIVSRFGAAVLAERFGGRRTLATTLLVQSVGTLLLLQIDGRPWLLYAFALVFGLGYGGEMVVFPILTREYFHPRITGSAYGYQIMGAGAGMAAGGLVAGIVFDWMGSYTAVIWLAAGLGLAGSAAILSLRPPHEEYRRLVASAPVASD